MLAARLMRDGIPGCPAISTGFTATLRDQMVEVSKLDAVIEANLRDLGYGG